MSENKITFPVKLASNNPQSFGIVDAIEVSGHRMVDTISDLYAISDPVLSVLKDGSDAIGQEWFVVSEDCKYRLDNWENRKSVTGWTKLPKQELINTKQSVSEKDQPGGYAGLDSNGKLPIEKTYGDTATIVEVETYELLPVAGLSSVIYYVSNTSAQYKWSGSAYIDITDGADNAKKNETSIFDCSNGTSTKYYSSLLDAINIVPPVYRTSNRIISYLSTENATTKAVNYQYHGIDSTTWTDLTKWERVPNQSDLAEIRSDLSELNGVTFGEFSGFTTGTTEIQYPILFKAGVVNVTLSCEFDSYGEVKLYDADGNVVTTSPLYVLAGSSVTRKLTLANDAVKIGIVSASGNKVEVTAKSEETLENLLPVKSVANNANETAVFARDNALGVIYKKYNTVGVDEFVCDLQVGTISFDVSSSSPAYSSIILYDESDVEIASQSEIYTQSGPPKHYDFNIATICKKIKITRNNAGPYYMVITSNKSLRNDVGALQEEVDELQDKTEPLYLTKDISSLIIRGYSGFRYNGAWAVNVKIDDNGNFLVGQSGTGMQGCLSFIDTACTKVHIQVQTYLSSGSSLLYAFYSSNTLFDSTTFLGGGLKVSTVSTAVNSIDVDVPSGTKVLVMCSYDADNQAKVIETLLVTKDIKNEPYYNTTPLSKVNNGTQSVYATENSFSRGGFFRCNIDRISHRINIESGENSSWANTNIFNPIGNKLVHIRFSVSNFNTNGNFHIAIAKGVSGSDNPITVKTIEGNGEYNVTFDATYYRVYHEYSDSFCIWLWSVNGVTTCQINDFVVYECEDELSLNNINGNNAREMFQSTDTNISGIKEQLDKPSFIISPNGGKYVSMVDNSGNLIAKSVIPSKCAFFGNSLMFGNSSTGVGSFGMCASDNQKDFYYLFNLYASQLNPNYTANRYSSVPFEIIDSVANIDSVVASVVSSLAGDEDLIIIQAGDNTSATQAETVFPQSTQKLLEAIRAKCPNARVFWPAIWYNTVIKFSSIRNACNRWGCTIVPIGDLNVPINMGTIGDLIDFGAVGTDTWTLENVSNLVENSSTNITATFTYQDVEATTTLDVTEYSLNGTTLSYRGRYRIVTLQYGHPGDRGMKAIANRLLFYIGLPDEESAYPLD